MYVYVVNNLTLIILWFVNFLIFHVLVSRLPTFYLFYIALDKCLAPYLHLIFTKTNNAIKKIDIIIFCMVSVGRVGEFSTTGSSVPQKMVNGPST